MELVDEGKLRWVVVGIGVYYGQIDSLGAGTCRLEREQGNSFVVEGHKMFRVHKERQ